MCQNRKKVLKFSKLFIVNNITLQPAGFSVHEDVDFFLMVWWHATTLFIYFYIYRADIQYLYILLVECHSCFPHCFPLGTSAKYDPKCPCFNAVHSVPVNNTRQHWYLEVRTCWPLSCTGEQPQVPGAAGVQAEAQTLGKWTGCRLYWKHRGEF
jgi:hypothetical protein